MKKSNLVIAVAMGLLLTSGAFAANEDLAVVNQAKELINQKKYKECEELLDKAVVTYPDSLRIKNALGQAKYQNGKLSEASSIFSQVLGKDSENTYAKTMLEKIRKEKLAQASPVSVAQNETDTEDFSNEDFSGSKKASSGTATFNVSNELPQAEQEALAKKCYDEMVSLDKWATADFIRLHTQVIEKCPLTDRAQESCWRLSNLYMLGVEPAEYENAIAVLEHLLKQYPDTPLMPDAKNRMLVVCQKIGDYTKVIKLYEELWQKDPEPDTKTYMIRALEYGNALAEAGKTEEATKWYNKVLEKDEGKNALEARAARKKLESL